MKITKSIKKHPILVTIVVLIIIIILGMIFFGGGSAKLETMTIHRADFINQISVSGKVVAAQSAELGFDQSGRVAAINSKVGDMVTTGSIIASIENGTARADIAQKQATLEKEQAKLTSLQKGTRPEELVLYQQKYDDASSALIIAMRNAYLQIENAIIGKTDTLFTNGNTVNPQIEVQTDSISDERNIENERRILSEKFQKWNNSLSQLYTSPSDESIRTIRTVGTDAELAAKTFVDHLLYITGNLSANNSGLSQTQIDTYRSTVNTAGQQISTASLTEQDSFTAWSSARNSLVLEKSGSTAEDVAAQAAQVKSAEADLQNAQAELRKTLVVAPFTGVVTKMDLKIGEIASPSVSEISIMSVGAFEVESYIPEVNIARVKTGDIADITLDAYGSDVIFPASIIAIDPAETQKDGVSTYKTRLRFTDNDPRIKSGMTANISITTDKKADVITIPQSIITEKAGKRFVQIQSGDLTNDVEITTGQTSGLGQVEVLSGLNEGDMVVLPPVVR